MRTMKISMSLFLAMLLLTFNSCSDDPTDNPPSKILITKIRVTSFPATDVGGAGWDLLDGADIFPQVIKGSNVLWDSPNYIENASPSSDNDFIPSPSVQISDLNATHAIDLYDFDSGSANDFIGGLTFTPASEISGTPSSFTLTGNDLAFEVFVDYVY